MDLRRKRRRLTAPLIEMITGRPPSVTGRISQLKNRDFPIVRRNKSYRFGS